ncbi:hypothetical protein B0H66DRAFT_386071 [Apodospora peruviana]|uniref:Uncharacterized protein n=1 Tax=Apodospora peruviana TaxID=516989 RepID=A0AAE0HV18_9PEZI|nr:hypothetical protein B0H66DRAFT_386071 [Apodospora peruviana]
MKITYLTLLAAASLANLTLAWRVGLWPYQGVGHDQQYSGTIGAGKCHTVDAIKLGQITFDPRTDFWADMHEVIVYADKSCDPDFKITSIRGIALTGRPVNPPKTAKSFLVQ